MQPYRSASGKQSGVTGFEIGDDYIRVFFESALYKYSYRSCGKDNVETMKRLATESNGLSSFIAQHRPEFESKK